MDTPNHIRQSSVKSESNELRQGDDTLVSIALSEKQRRKDPETSIIPLSLDGRKTELKTVSALRSNAPTEQEE